MFPYQDQYEIYCKDIKNLADHTLTYTFAIISDFFNFNSDQYPNGRDLKSINNNDLHNYFVHLKDDRNFKTRTINKYITVLKQYFTYLYTARFINHYPLANVRGLASNDKAIYFIKWEKHIPEMLNSLKPETALLLIAVATGFTPKEILNLRWEDISTHIKNTTVKSYVWQHLNFSETNNPYLFEDKRYRDSYNHPLTTWTTILTKIKPDQDKLKMNLVPEKLRLSHIYALVLRTDLTDEELMKLIHCNQKKLAYYRSSAMRLNLKTFKLSENI